MKHRGSLMIGILALTIVLFIPSPGFATGQGEQQVSVSETVTVTDLAGREVTLNYPVERIVLIRSRDIYGISAVLGDSTVSRKVRM